MEFDLENPLSNLQDQNLHFHTEMTSLFSIENDQMSSNNHLMNLKTNEFYRSFRKDVTFLIFQYSYNVDPFLSYLAVNYFDRFISSQNITQAKPWTTRLIAITCVSLATKMMKTEHSVFSIFQCQEGFIFETQTIERMEMLILRALKWRMRSITPFSFIKLFISLFELEDHPLTQALKTRAIEIIFKSQKDVEILEFKASVIAASALLLASIELFPLQFPCFSHEISKCLYVNKENLLKCYNTMEGIENESNETRLTMISSLNMPVSVLDRYISNSENKKTSTISTIAKIKTRVQERVMKRRKLGDLGNNNSFQLSNKSAMLKN